TWPSSGRGRLPVAVKVRVEEDGTMLVSTVAAEHMRVTGFDRPAHHLGIGRGGAGSLVLREDRPRRANPPLNRVRAERIIQPGDENGSELFGAVYLPVQRGLHAAIAAARLPTGTRAARARVVVKGEIPLYLVAGPALSVRLRQITTAEPREHDVY